MSQIISEFNRLPLIAMYTSTRWFLPGTNMLSLRLLETSSDPSHSLDATYSGCTDFFYSIII